MRIYLPLSVLFLLQLSTINTAEIRSRATKGEKGNARTVASPKFQQVKSTFKVSGKNNKIDNNTQMTKTGPQTITQIMFPSQSPIDDSMGSPGSHWSDSPSDIPSELPSLLPSDGRTIV